MGPPSEAGTEPLDYAPLDLTRARTISKAELDSLQPVAAVSRLRLDNEEPLDLDIADVEDGHGKSLGFFPTFSKGQLISECLFEKIVWTKIPTKNLIDSAQQV